MRQSRFHSPNASTRFAFIYFSPHQHQQTTMQTVCLRNWRRVCVAFVWTHNWKMHKLLGYGAITGAIATHIYLECMVTYTLTE